MEIYDKSRLINNKIKYIQQKMKKKNGQERIKRL